ncbi:MAG: OmpA family protein [Marinilabiliaceae bacterium]|nr:OmpA family protein [Marinilabiliaceae bacterium]
MRLVFALFLLVFFVACVPMKQFQDVQLKNEELKMEMKQLSVESENNKVKAKELEGKLGRLQKQIDQIIQDTIRLAGRLQNEQDRVAELEIQQNELTAKMRNMGNDDSADLMVFLQKLQDDLNNRENALLKTEQESAKRKKELELAITELESAREALLNQNKQLVELQNSLNRKDSAMNALRLAVADALTGFGTDELKVHMKNGKVYVSLEEKLLFASGSYAVNQMGESALLKLARVLEQKDDIQIVVEGHTDNVPYTGSVILDNWDLSVKRATAVSRILLQNSNIRPDRITAAGRGEYVPLDSSNSIEGRQKNRRTEIILTPSLDKLLEVLETN